MAWLAGWPPGSAPQRLLEAGKGEGLTLLAVTVMKGLALLVLAGAVGTAFAGILPEYKEELERLRKDVQPIMDKMMQTHKFHPGMVTDPNLAWLVLEALGGEDFNQLFDFDVYMRSVGDVPSQRDV